MGGRESESVRRVGRSTCHQPFPFFSFIPQTTYLDDRLRLGRGDKGSLFVTARVPPEGAAATKK